MFKKAIHRVLQSLDNSKKKRVIFLGVGIDIENIDSVKQRNCLLKNSVFFNHDELLYCKSGIESFATLICVKESFIKAIGCLKNSPQYSFKDIELVHFPTEKPYLKLHGELASFFKTSSLMSAVRISHTQQTAFAIVVIYKGGNRYQNVFETLSYNY